MSDHPKPPQPTGLCRVVGAEQTRQNQAAIYARVIVEDEAGKRWSYKTSCFLFDLKPVDEKENP